MRVTRSLAAIALLATILPIGIGPAPVLGPIEASAATLPTGSSGAVTVGEPSASPEVTAVVAEWTARVGTSGRNGRATMRAMSTGTGTLALSLRNMPRQRTYVASVVRGTCRAPITVVRAGSFRTSTTGSVRRTLALTSRATAAVRSVKGPIYVRLVSGPSIRCARLTPVSLYLGRLSWDVVPLGPDLVATRSPSSVAGVVVLGSRALVAGTVWASALTDPRAVIWTSTDGATWTSTDLGPVASRIAVAAGADRAVVVGSDRAWVTTDGVAWTSASSPPNLDSPYYPPSVTALPAGGFLAAFQPTATTPGCQLWSSTDGAVWSAVTSTGLPPGPCTSLLATDSAILALGVDGAATWMVRSVDGGATWTTVLRSTTDYLLRLSATNAGLVAFGSGGVWSSPDGLSWRRLGTPVARAGFDGVIVNDVTSFGPGLVAVGNSFIPVETEEAEVNVSGNGTTWRLSPLVPNSLGSVLIDAVAWGDRLIVVGNAHAFYLGEESRAMAWIGRVTPLSGS